MTKSVQEFSCEINKLLEFVNLEYPDRLLPGTGTIDVYLYACFEFKMEGLKAVYDALNDPGLLRLEKSNVEEFKEKLLQDLKQNSQSHEYYMDPYRPKFDVEFLQEANKPSSQQSDTFKTFLKEFVKSDKSPACIAAAMLIELSKEDVSKESLQQVFDATLQRYKTTLELQVEKDLPRDSLLIKGPGDKIQIIDTRTALDTLRPPILTGEQFETLATLCFQGKVGGYFGFAMAPEDPVESSPDEPKPSKEKKFKLSELATKISNLNDKQYVDEWYIDTNQKRGDIMLDLSTEGKVILHNFGYMVAQETSDRKLPAKDWVVGTLKIDISELKGERFINGCADKSPEITVTLRSLDPRLLFEIPDKLPTKPIDETFSQYLQAYIPVYLDIIMRSEKYREKFYKKLISFVGQEKAAELIFPHIINSEVDANEKHQLLASLPQKPKMEFTDTLKIVASEILAETARKQVNKTPLTPKETKFLEFLSADNAQYEPLREVIANISEQLKKQEEEYKEEKKQKKQEETEQEGLEFVLHSDEDPKGLKVLTLYARLESNPEKLKAMRMEQIKQYCQSLRPNHDKLETTANITLFLDPKSEAERRRCEEEVKAILSVKVNPKELTWYDTFNSLVQYINRFFQTETIPPEIKKILKRNLPPHLADSPSSPSLKQHSGRLGAGPEPKGYYQKTEGERRIRSKSGHSR